MVNSFTSQEQYLDTGIANFGMVMNEPTPTAVQSEQSDDTPSPQEMAEAQRAMNKLLSERGELEAALNDPSLSAEQKDSLKKSQQTVSSSIGSLNAAIGSKSRMGITAALQIAALATAGAQSAETKSEAASHLSSGASYGGGGHYDYSSDMRASNYSQLSASSKANYNTLSNLNIGGFNGYSALTQTQLAVSANQNWDADTKIGLSAMSVIEQTPKLKEQVQTQAQTGQTVLDKTLDSARASGNQELIDALEKRKELVEKFGVGAKHAMAEQRMADFQQKLAAGTATPEEIKTYTDRLNARNEKLEAKHNAAAKDTFNRLDDQSKEFLRAQNGGKDPSAEQIFEMSKKTYDKEKMNDISWVIKNHPDDYMKHLSKEQKEMWVGAQAKIGFEGRKQNIALGEFMDSLSPDQQKKFKEELLEAYKNDPAKAQEMLQSMAKDPNVDPKKLKAVQDFVKNMDYKGLDLALSASMTPNDLSDDRKFDAYNQIKAEADLHKLEGAAREKFMNSGALYYAQGYDYDKFYTLSPDAKATTTTNAALSASLTMDTPAAGSTVAAGAAAGASAGMFARTSTDGSATGGSTDTTTESQAVGAAAQVKVAAPSLTVSDPNQRIIAPEATQTTPSTDTKDLQAALANGGFSQGALTVGSTATASPAQEQAQAVAQQQNQQPSSGSTSLSQALANGGFNTVAFQQQLQGTPVVITSANENIAPAIVPNVIAAAGTTPIQRA